MSAAQDEYNELFRDKARISSHPEDTNNDDAASFLDDASDEPSTPTAPAHPPVNNNNNNSRARYLVPSERQYSNTGPKGVIADAQNYRDAQRIRRTSKDTGRPSFATQRSSSHHQQQQTQPFFQPVPSRLAGKGTVDSDDEGGDDEENRFDENEELDDEFLDSWRQNRLRELQGTEGKQAARIGSSGREREAGRVRYGGLLPVDGEGYLEAVDGSGSVTVVVVFIYDDRVSFSLSLFSTLLDPSSYDFFWVGENWIGFCSSFG